MFLAIKHALVILNTTTMDLLQYAKIASILVLSVLRHRHAACVTVLNLGSMYLVLFVTVCLAIMMSAHSCVPLAITNAGLVKYRQQNAFRALLQEFGTQGQIHVRVDKGTSIT